MTKSTIPRHQESHASVHKRKRRTTPANHWHASGTGASAVVPLTHLSALLLRHRHLSNALMCSGPPFALDAQSWINYCADQSPQSVRYHSLCPKRSPATMVSCFHRRCRSFVWTLTTVLKTLKRLFEKQSRNDRKKMAANAIHRLRRRLWWCVYALPKTEAHVWSNLGR